MRKELGEEDRARALRLVAVSRETEARLAVYADLLRRWQPVINLVAPASLPHLWTRHFADSAQLRELVPDARVWVDMGSGAGFPGLVLALLLAGSADVHVHLIESDRRKCAFLRAVIRETEACASVVPERIESALATFKEPVDAVTARALAPMDRLLDYGRSLLEKGAVGVFPKGRGVHSELTAAPELRSFQFDLVPSRTDPEGRIVLVRLPRSKDG